jgi:putative spermidine/putrescine transport system ATP-binding protein
VTGTAASSTTAARAGVEVRLERLVRRYGAVTALDGLDLTLHPGELVALLGPSGCGKTTALRLLAGLESADGGHVIVGGKDISDLPTNKRDMGMVFQAYSLFPHMTALQNVAFGLRLRKMPESERHRRAGEMLDLVGLTTQAGRYAHQMSGGQQQRVALARALAIRPTVLLLDEPLSALDAKVRAQLRDEIRRVQLEVGITTLFVTHDQEEALAIADRVGVMQAGRLEQLGAPTAVYGQPATPFVAEFVGLTNKLPARVGDGVACVLGVPLPLVDPSSPAGTAIALVRPETIGITSADGAPGTDGADPLRGTVIANSFLGAVSRISVDVTGTGTVIAQLPTSEALGYTPGTPVRLTLRADPVLVTRADAASNGSGVAAAGVDGGLER